MMEARSDEHLRECINTERSEKIRSLFCDQSVADSKAAGTYRELAARAGRMDTGFYVLFVALLVVAAAGASGAYRALTKDSSALARAQETRLRAEAGLEQEEFDLEQANARRTSRSRRIAGR